MKRTNANFRKKPAAKSGTPRQHNKDAGADQSADDNLRRLSAHLMQIRDEERRQISRDLHDSTGQKLVVLKMNLSLLDKALNGDSNVAELVTDSIKMVDEATSEIRSLSHMLYPPLLDEVGLVSAVRWLLDGFKKRTQIEFELKTDDHLGRLPRNAEITVFRVLEESLDNIVQHSGATEATVQLTRDDHHLMLTTSDNGKGLPQHSAPEDESTLRLGILGLKERLAGLGGNLEIASRPGRTVVTATLPIESNQTQS